MSTFNKYKWTQLADLGAKIILDLSENINGDGVPGRTSRFCAIENMIKYLELHDYEVK
jgi:hypothetical protein